MIDRPFLALAAIVPPAFWLFSLALGLLDRQGLRVLAAEDGPLETLQVALLLGCAGLAAWTSVALARTRKPVWSAVYGVSTLAFLFLCAEEVSWGQRIFGWGTPDWLAHNAQEESNLHNLPGVSSIFSLIAILAPAGMAVATLLLWPRRERLRSLQPHLWLPHPVVAVSLLCVVSYVLLRWADRWYFGLDRVHAAVSRLQEPSETILYFGALVFFIMVAADVRGARSNQTFEAASQPAGAPGPASGLGPTVRRL